MAWLFLVLALWAALVELHSGTFYLAAVAVAAMIAAVAGIWVRGDLLPFVFLLACVAMLPPAMYARRRLARRRGLADFDIGQEVTVLEVSPGRDRLVVSHRGSRWDAVLDSGPAPQVGDLAVIVRKSGAVLHLATRPGASRPVPQEPAA